MKVLVTGGTGYIGSHTVCELLESGHEVVVLDNLSNSSLESLNRVKQITGKDVTFYEAELLDKSAIEDILSNHQIDACIHFAGLKAVGESVSKPIEYYHNNITGTLNLLNVLREYGVKKLIFSSSATVYGDAKIVPVTEETDKGICTNPYGWTKWMQEQIFEDLYASDNEWSICLLRYFNPIGAHESGLIGEDPSGIPNNLMPYISQVAVGKLKELSVFGNDYDTVDGTGVRDYIHVVDLARGHVAALDSLSKTGVSIYNLGTGRGVSVLEIIDAFERVNDIKVPYRIVDRRPGDVASLYADVSKAKKELGWEAEFDIDRMCRDSYRWQKNNPKGYRKE